MRKTAAEYLAAAPAAVRRTMLEDVDRLAPGSAAVIGRFFDVMRARRDPSNLPSADTFRIAAESEPTFRLLLRTLHSYAPHISTANAVEVSREWYARRRGPSAASKATASLPGTRWPALWQGYAQGLDAAPIREVSRKRYRASVDRCAQLFAEGHGSDQLGFVTAASLAEGFVRHPDPKRRVRPVTAANYLDGLIALGRFGGARPESLDAMRLVTGELREEASLLEKTKEARIAALMERGGYDHVGKKIGTTWTRAKGLPEHSAAWRRSMQTAVVLAVLTNKPPRKADLARWRIGHEVLRNPDGTWEAAWEQLKTGRRTEAGPFWEPVCEILDAWILGGRPDRFVHLRYQELIGTYLLSLDENPANADLPSELTNVAIGVPSHDLRTLAADYLRWHDPVNAANVIRTHLGHASTASGDAYRSACLADVAQSAWRSSRAMIAAGSA